MIEMSEESRTKDVTTKTFIWVAVLSIVLTVIWDLWKEFLPPIAACTQSFSSLIPSPGVELMGLPFLMVMIAMALIRIPSMRKYLSSQNLVYLYATFLAVSYFTAGGGAFGSLLFGRILNPPHVTYIPEFVAPSSEVADLLQRGIGSIEAMPWADLFPVIIWNFLMFALFGGVSISLANIFRRQWMDVEMMPFPQVMLIHTALINVESSVKREWPSKSPFLLGMIVGFLLAIPLSGATLFPWFPDIYGWRTETCGPGSQWFAPPDVPWNLGFTKHAPLYALLLLVPVHALFSLMFYTLVYEATVFIAFYTGNYTGYLQKGFCARAWCAPDPFHSPPLSYAAINVGAVSGLFVITLFLNRSYILETLRAAFGKSGRTELERKEPMSYRSSWILLIVSFLLVIVFFILTGLSPWVSFVLTLTGIITWFTMAQLWGRIGFNTEPCYDFAPGFVRLMVWPTVAPTPSVTSTDLALAPYITEEWVSHGASLGWGASFYTTLASYKMAGLTGVDTRSLLKVTVVALLISMFATMVVRLIIYGIFGKAATSSPSIYPMESVSNRLWGESVNIPMTEALPWISLGFVFMVVIRYLYTRILWIPDPLMAIPAWSYLATVHGVWFACLVIWIIKTIILKVGGSKLYEERIVPFAGGFMIGNALEVLIAGIISFTMFR
jgi:hypothetical protein